MVATTSGECKMTDYLPVLLLAIGCVVVFICMMIVRLGQDIDDMETPKSGGYSSFSSPTNASMITSAIVIGIYVAGCGCLINDDKVIMIAGVGLAAFSILIAITTLIFEFAVMNKISINNKNQ